MAALLAVHRIKPQNFNTLEAPRKSWGFEVYGDFSYYQQPLPNATFLYPTYFGYFRKFA